MSLKRIQNPSLLLLLLYSQNSHSTPYPHTPPRCTVLPISSMANNHTEAHRLLSPNEPVLQVDGLGSFVTVIGNRQIQIQHHQRPGRPSRFSRLQTPFRPPCLMVPTLNFFRECYSSRTPSSTPLHLPGLPSKCTDPHPPPLTEMATFSQSAAHFLGLILSLLSVEISLALKHTRARTHTHLLIYLLCVRAWGAWVARSIGCMQQSNDNLWGISSLCLLCGS